MNINDICKTEYCTGCSACMNCCKQNAIIMQPDSKGFSHPVIDSSLCVNCGLCKITCPQNKRITPSHDGQVYAALAINDSIRANSSSGGIFSLLAERVIKSNGVVFGAALCKDLSVHHIMIDSIDQICLLQGSKYVQSTIGNCYRQVKKLLDVGRKVLFSGTPCQIDGLYHYLNKEYNNLLTVGILCHGVPSSLVLSKFIDSKEQESQKKVININFRDKDPGWTSFSTAVYYSNGTKEIDNSYYNFFVKDYCLRDSCYHCLYSSTKRIEDITIGDYWGYQESGPEHIEDDDKGISLVLINTKKAEKAFNKIKGKIDCAKRTKEDACRGNQILLHPFTPHKDSEQFWKDFSVLAWSELVEKYNISREKKKDRMTKIDRNYFSRPYKQRRVRHLISCAKQSILHRIGSH